MTELAEDYLWDRSGTPDPKLVEMEERLGTFAESADIALVRPRAAPEPRRGSWGGGFLVAAALALGVGLGAAALVGPAEREAPAVAVSAPAPAPVPVQPAAVKSRAPVGRAARTFVVGGTTIRGVELEPVALGDGAARTFVVGSSTVTISPGDGDGDERKSKRKRKRKSRSESKRKSKSESRSRSESRSKPALGGGSGLGEAVVPAKVGSHSGADGESHGPGLTKDQIRTVVRAGTADVRKCYKALLQDQPDAHGRLVLQLVIAPTGKVREVVVSSSDVGGTDFRNCVVGVARKWTFAKPNHGSKVVVTYPFIFQPG